MVKNEPTEMEIHGRAHGHCASCEIAINFEKGDYDQKDLDDCKDCQSRRALLEQLEREGEESSKRIEVNLQWLKGRFPST